MIRLYVTDIKVNPTIPTMTALGQSYSAGYSYAEYEITIRADQQIDPYELADRINDSCSVKEFRELQEYANELLYIIQKNPEAYREYEKRRLVKEILK